MSFTDRQFASSYKEQNSTESRKSLKRGAELSLAERRINDNSFLNLFFLRFSRTEYQNELDIRHKQLSFELNTNFFFCTKGCLLRYIITKGHSSTEGVLFGGKRITLRKI